MGALVAVSLFPNCFEKAKAGGHFLFFGRIAQTFIKCPIVALAHNGWLHVIEKPATAVSSMLMILIAFWNMQLVSCLGGKVARTLIKCTAVVLFFFFGEGFLVSYLELK